MKRLYVIPLSILALTASAVKISEGFHAERSSLSEGHWVKVRVDSTGMYKLTYDQLRELGFNNPDSVAIFGKGLFPQPEQFVDDNGNIIIDADLPQIPTINADDALYFFGVGSSWMTYQETEDSRLSHFDRINNSIYSHHGYYLLTDSKKPLAMDSIALPDDAMVAAGLAEGFSYVLNDKRLTHGFFKSGQIYLGERYTDLNSKLSWNLTPLYATPGSRVTVSAAAYSDDSSGPSGSDAGDVLKFKVGDAESSRKLPQADTGSWTNLIPDLLSSSLNGLQIEISTWIEGKRPLGKAALDYWIMTYGINPSEAIADNVPVVVPIDAGQYSRIEMPAFDSDVSYIDVANPLKPRIMPVAEDDSHSYLYVSREAGAGHSRPFEFRRSLAVAPEIVGEVGNSNIHHQASEGADLLIITVPKFYQQAERLAEIHRRYDGMKCLVVNVEDVYNEYSSGQPTIMAYKSLVKQLYLANADKHLDVLLFGPLKGDMLGVEAENAVDYREWIIAYQNALIPQKGDSHNINEFVGMMDDNIAARMEYAPIQVGVGILPVLSNEEAARIVDKVERYITEPNYELITNKMMGIGGAGDNQTHVKQAMELKKHIQSFYEDGLIYNSHFSEALPKSGQLERFVDNFNSGQSLMNYMGHGSAETFDKIPLMTKGYLWALKNHYMPFVCLGMCDATGPDRGHRGLGESLVLEINSGAIGGVMSTRTAYSNQNASMLRLLAQALAPDLGTAAEAPKELLKPKTIGEAYAEARSTLRTLHENTFALICDPALRLVTPVGRMKLPEEVSPIMSIGAVTKLSGDVLSNAGNVMTGFNGKCVARIMVPESSSICPNTVSGQDLAENLRAVISYDSQVDEIFYGTVKNGVWEIDFTPSESQIIYDNSTLKVILSAYDSDNRVGAAGVFEASFQKMEGGKDYDSEAPVITGVNYDESRGCVDVEVSDNCGISFGTDRIEQPLTMKLDGRPLDLRSSLFTLHPGSPFVLKGSVSVGILHSGEHILQISVADVFGNTASCDYSFSTGISTPEYVLSASAELTNSDITFSIDSAAKGRLMIADHSGNTVAHREFEGAEVIFDLCDNSGRRLPQGEYKAWVMTDSPSYGHSSAVNFGILAPLKRQ